MKRFLFLSAFMVTAFLPPAAWAAPDRAGKTDVGVNVSAIDTDSGSLDSTVYVGGTVAHGLNRWLAIGAEGGWYEPNATGGDLSVVPFYVDAIARFSEPRWRFVPYGVLGIGGVMWDLDGAANRDPETDFAVKVGVGVDWFHAENVILNVEAAYANVDESDSLSGAGLNDLDYWQIGGGFKYVF